MPSQISSAFGVLLLVLTAAAHADYVVLQSESVLFGVGALLEDDTPLRLGDDERIVLLSENGDLVEIHGPFEGHPEGDTVPELDMRTALTNLIDSAEELHASLGSTRGGITLGSRNTQRNAWQLDALRSGRQCVVADSTVEFWRAETDEELHLEIQRPGRDGVAVITWPATVAEAPWPESVPLINDAMYVLRRAGWTEAALIRVTVLKPEVAHHPQTAIAWLAAHGCGRQAELLMSELE